MEGEGKRKERERERTLGVSKKGGNVENWKVGRGMEEVNGCEWWEDARIGYGG